MNRGVAIIGFGVAGASAALKLREFHYPGPITIFGQEACLAYDRPALSKTYLLSQDHGPEAIALNALAKYHEEAVNVRLDESVKRVRPTKDGVEISASTDEIFDYAIVATGAGARHVELEGAQHAPLFYLRDEDDARAIRAASNSGTKLLIVGGGVIGVEIAATIKSQGANVTVVERDDEILVKHFSTEIGEQARRLHEKNGISFKLRATVCSINQVGKRHWEAQLSNGENIPFDVLVVGVGVEPRDELGKAAGLDVDDGILVDDTGQTSCPKIYAIGDVARRNGSGGSRRIESYQNAIQSAERAAAAIAGVNAPKQDPEWFWSDQGELNLQSVGDRRRFAEVHDVLRKEGGQSGLTQFFYDGDQLVGAVALNDGRSIAAVKRLLKVNATIAPSELANHQLDLRDLCKAALKASSSNAG